MKTTQNTWLGRLAIAGAIVAAFAIGLSVRGGNNAGHTEHTAGAEEATTWTCSMHPQIQMPTPGQCPLCGMDLIPLVTSDSGSDGPRSLTLSAAAQAIAEIQTTAAVHRDVETSIRLVGKLEADESRIREIAAWVPGRIDRLYVDYTGVQVRKGQKLFGLYSPDLYSAQEELVQAIRASAELQRSGLSSTRQSASRNIEASKEKLRLWGLTAEQIAAVESNGAPSEQVTIVAPISGTVLHKDALEGSYVKTGTHVYTIADLSVLWLKLDVYESDIAWVALGQDVRFTTDTYPGEQFEGTVSFIDPVLDPRSRSIKVRVDVKNSAGRLKPGMFTRAVVHADVRGADGEQPLVIPKTAPLVTGKRAVVYVADIEQPGQYHGREVVLGPQAGDYVVVREGLLAGEMVVSHGAFKIDSALQIVAKSSMMNPSGGGPAPGHNHGGGDSPPRDFSEQSSAEPIADVPQDFRVQLDDMLALYFDLSAALSQDDLASAKTAARALPKAIARPQHALLPAAGHAPWGQAQDELRAAAKAIADASDIGVAREAFYELSVTTLRAVRQFQPSGNTPVLLYHCPMAMDGAGADWLQMKEGTENPYYGSQMFKCGSQTETLVADTDAKTEPGSGHANH